MESIELKQSRNILYPEKMCKENLANHNYRFDLGKLTFNCRTKEAKLLCLKNLGNTFWKSSRYEIISSWLRNSLNNAFTVANNELSTTRRVVPSDPYWIVSAHSGSDNIFRSLLINAGSKTDSSSSPPALRCKTSSSSSDIYLYQKSSGSGSYAGTVDTVRIPGE